MTFALIIHIWCRVCLRITLLVLKNIIFVSTTRSDFLKSLNIMNRLRFIISIIISFALQSATAQTANMVGDASDLGGDCFRITPDQQYQTGAVWYTEQLDLTRYFSLEVEMSLGTTDGEGADGCILGMQTEGVDALGVNGQFLGFGGISPSFGLEFDTFNNDTFEFNGDIAADHLAMLQNGDTNHNTANNLAGPVAIFPGGANAENGQPISLRLVWNPEVQEIKAYMDCNLRLSANIDLVNDIFQGETQVYWGFTGATGFYDNEHSVCLIEVSYLNPLESELLCEGETIQLAINSLTAENIEWSPSINIDNINSATPSVNPTTTTEYIVEYDKCGEQFSDTVLVEVISMDLDEVNDIEVCPGEEAEFTAVYNPLYDIEWSNGEVSTNSSVYFVAGNHWVEVSDGVCLKRMDFYLLENELPIIDMPTTSEYCELDSVLILPQALNSVIFFPVGVESNSFYLSVEGTYEVIAQDTLTGCVNSSEITISELPLPIIELESEYEICSFETLDISLSNLYSAEWSNGDFTNSTEYSNGGFHTVIAELNGCESSFEFELSINPLPVSNLPGDYTFCEDSTLTLASSNSNYNITWHNGLIGDEFTFTEPGEFPIEIEDAITGCNSAGILVIAKILNPELVLEEVYYLCEGEEIEIQPFFENAESLYWSSGIEADSELFSEPTEFEVTIFNDCKTENVTSQIEGVICDCIPYIPLAFTPDNDGINEVFKPILTCEPFEYSLAIYNRWGEEVFFSNDPEESWVGDDQKGDYYVPTGVYSYRLSYKSEQFDGVKVEIRNGMVSVIR